MNSTGTRHSPGATLAALAGAQFTVMLATSIVNVALPQIRAGAGLSDSGTTWVVNAYGLAFGALLLAGGRAADLLGHRRTLLAGLTVFGLSSLTAGPATSSAVLIAARVVQGLGAAAIAPAALALVMGLFPPGAGRGRALGVWGAVSGAGGAAGVLLGGALTQAWGWPWIFYAVAIGAFAVLAAAAATVPKTRVTEGGRFDTPGTATVTLALTALVWGLTSARRSGWTDTTVLSAFAVTAVLLTAFVLVERRHPNPLLPPRLFRTGRVAAGNLLMALLGSVWIALFFFLPLYQQQVLGLSPLVTGLGQLPLAFANMLGSTLAPRISRRIGSTATVTGALVTEAAGLLWLSRISAHGSFAADVLGPSVLIGLGLSIAFVQLTGLAVEGVPSQDSGLAGGLVNTTRQVGGAIGLAVLATLAGTTTAHSAGRQPHLEALTAGYRTAFGVSAAVLAAAAALALLLSIATRRTAHQPKGITDMFTIDATAPVIVRLSTVIDAPLERVWTLHTDIDSWASWNTDIDQAQLDGPLLPGNSFHWKTHGLDITSTIREIVPCERLVWGGPANGIDGVHVWTFERSGDQVTVHTEESWSGTPVEAATDELGQALNASLTAWLAALKARAEQTA
ncbi:DHA2 family efflux MFS transporter permease subunit [Streptomyces sp. NPDC048411]|uniref:DHA2 family efflux MFS transporter permease subunit n=1 Tax=Streptomyces sp. NPDC048411 TaxID=3157206 RepID=UPI003453A5CE